MTSSTDDSQYIKYTQSLDLFWLQHYDLLNL